MRVVGEREMRHLEPVFLRDHVHALLVWAAGCHHKPNFVQSRLVEHVVGDDQMTKVDGVERPEVEPHSRRVSGCCGGVHVKSAKRR